MRGKVDRLSDSVNPYFACLLSRSLGMCQTMSQLYAIHNLTARRVASIRSSLMNAAADRVRLERLRRKWSVRHAASVGGISNTHWQAFENGLQELTPGLSAAIARAFDWEMTWADSNGDYDLSAVIQSVRDSTAQLVELRNSVRSLEAEVLRLQGIVDRLPPPSDT
jgi:transcriptional regulator with XRE-family HTH domain